ncbi:hypothetical protein [Moorena sp. SIO1F2]|nr:hypothetical protein [Moorena sp. SIO1F2]
MGDLRGKKTRPTPYSLLPAPCSLLPAPYSLLPLLYPINYT